MRDIKEKIIGNVIQFQRVSGIASHVLDYRNRDFLSETECAFCMRCKLSNGEKCDYRNTHLYGCFEAERWNGLYIYYCPLGLGFISTVIYDGGRAEYAFVSGPIVIGSLADTLSDNMGIMTEKILNLPCKTPGDTNAVAQIQQILCAFLSGKDAEQCENAVYSQSGLHNTLYEVTAELRGGANVHYPLELERRLQRMITNGDRSGARELINQFLGHMYFSASGDFKDIKENAKELVILFSRAAIEGGADAGQIFGNKRDILATIDGFKTLEDLSMFITSTFYRFVGYVFDFEKIKHADLVHKVLTYVREHYCEKITLDDISSQVFLNRTYLSSILKEELGMSFTDFINSIRIEKSVELLENNSLSLAEISDLVGFSDQSYFGKVFGRIMGVSPGEYRKNRGRR